MIHTHTPTTMELISNSIIYSAIFLLSLFLCCFFYLSTSSKPKTGSPKVPPEVGGAGLFTGHLHLMDGRAGSLPHITFGTLADKYGPAFTFRLGVHRVLVVNTRELAKELFTTHDVAVSNRPSLRVNKYLSYDNAMVGFAPYGTYWREIRKLISVELLTARRIELQKKVRMSELAQFTKELFDKAGSTGKVLVDMKEWFGNLNMNVVMRIVAGKRLYGGADGAEMLKCREVVRDFFHFLGVFLPGDALPYLSWLDLGGLEKRMKRTAIELDKIVGKWLVEHRENPPADSGRPQDFMDVMLSLIQTANLQAHYDDDTIVKATCLIMVVGGIDTIPVSLIWTLSLLLNNPHTLKKAQAELDKNVGRERRVDESDIDNLVYLQAIVKESLRLYPASPLGGMREFNQDCTVGGFHVPKGTRLLVNVLKIQTDPKIWDDPLEFKPERFLDKNVDFKGGDYELLPFGGGRRVCPGINFGILMLQIVLANLLQAFDLSTVNDQPVDMTGSAGFTNLKSTPLDVLVAPRLSPSLY